MTDHVAAVRASRGWLAICLVPAFRGKRLGPMLFTEYLQLLREKSSLTLLQFECITQNTRALSMYERFGCVVDKDVGDLLYYHVKFDAEGPHAGDGNGVVEMVRESEDVDLDLPWLQRRQFYSWQREMTVLLTGVHRMFGFRRAGSEDVVLTLAVEPGRDPPRVNGVAYKEGERPGEELFRAALEKVAGILGVKELVFSNEPGSSELITLFEKVGKQDELSQKHLTYTIER
jgi:hypothetical protein